MRAHIINFFTAPTFPDDEEKTRRARALNALHLYILGGILLIGGLAVLFFFNEKFFSSIFMLAGLATTSLSMVLNRRGQVQSAGIILLLSFWILTVLMISLSSGIRSLDIMFFISGTIVAGIIFGANGAYVYAGISLLTGLAFVIAEMMGVEFAQFFGFPPLSAWILLFINLTFTVIPLQVAFKSLSALVTRAQISEERYRQVASVISDYVFSIQHGPDGSITNQWISGAFETITGYTEEEFNARGGWKSLLHPEDLLIDKQDFERLQTNHKLITEIRIIRKDGDVRWVRIYAHPIWDETQNRLAGIYGAVQNISGNKWIETSLRQRAEEVALLYRLGAALSGEKNLYEALRAFVRELKQIMDLDAFHIGLYNFETDDFYYPLFLNLDKDLQLPPRKLREKPGLTWEVISTKKTLYLPDITDPKTQGEHNIVIVVDAGLRSYVGIPLMIEERVIGIMSVQSAKQDAYTKEQIQLLETIATQVAITIEKLSLLEQVQRELAERTRAEAELKDSESILEVVAAAANTFLKTSEWNEEAWRQEVDRLLEQLGSTIRASHAYIFENIHYGDGSPLMSMTYEWSAPNIPSDINNPKYYKMNLEEDELSVWKESILRGLPFMGDGRHLDEEGMEVLRSLGIQALLDVPIFIDDAWWGVIGFDDVTNSRNWSNAEVGALILAANLLSAAVKRRQMDLRLQDELHERKTLNEELGDKNAELERFTYTVSHDLRSPLVTIQGFLGYLQKSASEGNMAAFENDYARISRATLRMDKLLKDLLEISRIGRVLNKQQDLPFEMLIKEVEEIVHGRLQQGHITLQTQPNLPSIHGDKPRLIEVLQNLIDNAAKYMGNQPNPVIEIGLQGYEPETNKPIFYVRDNGMGIAHEYHERIFRLFEKLDPDSEGTGVGLALVKRIIEFHSGRIWLESEPGKGTTFFFTLPNAVSDK
ncbi:MAG: GAF domain-containing protein [Anaerolineae bacterium]|nr:GAF domain-containing protein [Anaerolineae bacterium]